MDRLARENLHRLMSRQGLTVDEVAGRSGLDVRTVRGILDGSDYEWRKGPHPFTIGIYGTNVEVNGITITRLLPVSAM